MANVDRPNGLLPVKNYNGAPYNAAIVECSVAVGNDDELGIGTPVTLTGTGDAQGRPGVEECDPSSPAFGVITGFKITAPSGVLEHPGYVPVSTAATVYVDVNKDTLYEINADDDGGTIAVTDIGETADYIIGTFDTTTGNPNIELDTSSIGTGVGLLIMGFSQRADNEVGSANAKILVKLNEHTDVAGGDIGV